MCHQPLWWAACSLIRPDEQWRQRHTPHCVVYNCTGVCKTGEGVVEDEATSLSVPLLVLLSMYVEVCCSVSHRRGPADVCMWLCLLCKQSVGFLSFSACAWVQCELVHVYVTPLRHFCQGFLKDCGSTREHQPANNNISPLEQFTAEITEGNLTMTSENLSTKFISHKLFSSVEYECITYEMANVLHLLELWVSLKCAKGNPWICFYSNQLLHLFTSYRECLSKCMTYSKLSQRGEIAD